MQEDKTIKIDQDVVTRLLRKIIIIEKMNLKTNEYSYGPIVKKIKAMIEEEVECY